MDASENQKYVTEEYPRCSADGPLLNPRMSGSTGHVGIILREPERYTRLQAVNGHGLRCSYRLAWVVIRRGRQQVRKHRFRVAIRKNRVRVNIDGIVGLD